MNRSPLSLVGDRTGGSHPWRSRRAKLPVDQRQPTDRSRRRSKGFPEASAGKTPPTTGGCRCRSSPDKPATGREWLAAIDPTETLPSTEPTRKQAINRETKRKRRRRKATDLIRISSGSTGKECEVERDSARGSQGRVQRQMQRGNRGAKPSFQKSGSRPSNTMRTCLLAMVVDDY